MDSDRILYLTNRWLSEEKIRSVRDKTIRGIIDPFYCTVGCNMIGETVSMSILINGLATKWPPVTTLKLK